MVMYEFYVTFVFRMFKTAGSRKWARHCVNCMGGFVIGFRFSDGIIIIIIIIIDIIIIIIVLFVILPFQLVHNTLL
jgi:hypothetical protein